MMIKSNFTWFFNDFPEHSHSQIRTSNIPIRECRKYDIRNITKIEFWVLVIGETRSNNRPSL